MDIEKVIKKLKLLSNPKNVEGMARFGINPKYALGVNVPVLRKLAADIEKELKNKSQEKHKLASKLWGSKIHEVRILASMIDVPELVTQKQMDSWIKEFNSWDLCDQICMNLFDKTPFAFDKAAEWSKKHKEFEKRAGFALMACLAWHDKNAADKKFLKFLPLIKNASKDKRNFVKKAVNWALRQIGKRNQNLKKTVIILAREIQKMDNKTANWIAKDALKELLK
ncbi:MAG: hypothetical protein ACD_57C00272G0002 [uncultured bacterium]|uniref:DNA alkylation repair protein n=1 Tax=Candidatus Woesebacteria bacterium RIFCSPLOWO2_01_FULL_39_21 TaxID=1802519 RepID=A0A1F8BHH4_9BACT|nr:MAG: hypothetical protein ACD_57C00272G0002 [uncultured bacterium]OGM22716.1 MAG: DNA alkylation repair protein [Candidatus Woesebacteria bacterium RIFCSPHIGHO2_01_FULL_39_23]OGM63410.1 MAG: DNA alkylation repair protein [Candidatus Woesebacteria bacterium RIFCSPLOWO2_01_FULL_39_21]